MIDVVSERKRDVDSRLIVRNAFEFEPFDDLVGQRRVIFTRNTKQLVIACILRTPINGVPKWCKRIASAKYRRCRGFFATTPGYDLMRCHAPEPMHVFGELSQYLI